jgi:hypothetical protein
MTGIVLFAMTAVRFWTLLTLNKQGWITRREDAEVAEGQGAGSLGAALSNQLDAIAGSAAISPEQTATANA